MVVKENKERMYAVDTALRGNLKKEKKEGGEEGEWRVALNR